MTYRPRPCRVSVDALPRSYVCYDLETTGLGPDARIVEIGAVRVIDGWEDEKFDTFVAPPAGVRMEPGARAVNRITDAMLAGAPDEAEALGAFCRFAEDFALVGQNIVAFDNVLLDRAAARQHVASPTRNGFVDTMVLYRELVGKPASLAAICGHYGVSNPQAHRAWADAVATSDCYQAILKDAASRRLCVEDLDQGPRGEELAGELVCFTGNSYELPKRDMEVLALLHGAQLSKGVTRRVTMLVELDARAGRKTAKLRRARELGTPVVRGEDLLARLGLTARDLRR
ncbi:MAG: exonuclease domain-containing protein [Parafannyhessea sp.]|uniref:exonuclease domain-containing protein n=1 Tax=Parafannyhessea sp. TaxID=2847324 RepID=UPI003F0F4BA1